MSNSHGNSDRKRFVFAANVVRSIWETPAIFPQEAKKPKKQAKRTKKPSPNEWNCGYFRPAWDVGTFDRLDFWSLLWSDVLDGEMPWIELQYSVCSFY